MKTYTDDQLTQDVAAALNAEADAAFPADRLARQQARILQRIEQDGRPGRVISFPASQAHVGPTLRGSSSTRWVAAAAAAAFVVGVLTGRSLPPHQSVAPVAVHEAQQPTGTTLSGSMPLVPSDDEFLGEIEIVARRGPAVLHPLDALTPRAGDIEVGH
jgi:hypothetical protein